MLESDVILNVGFRRVIDAVIDHDAISSNRYLRHPLLEGASDIVRLLGDHAVEHVHERVHLQPELATTGVEGGPRGLQILAKGVVRYSQRRPDVARDRQTDVPSTSAVVATLANPGTSANGW